MSESELVAIYNAEHEADKVSWEQVRTQCFYTIIAQSGTKHFKKPSDLFKFPWEQKDKAETKQSAQLTPEQFKELAEQINILQNE